MRRGFLIVVISICLSLLVAANEKNLFDDRDDSLLGSGYFEDGVLTNGRLETGSVFLSVPGLTKNYTFTGRIKIVEIGSQPWNGLRVIIGANSSMDTSKILLTKEWDVRVEFKMNNLNDLIGYFGAINEGMEIDFEVTRDGQRFMLKLNDEVCLEEDIPEELDAFEEGYEYNLGFEASDCYYEVSNIEIYCPDVPDATPTPEETQKPTETPEVTVSNTPLQTEELKGTEPNRRLSPVVIGICTVAVVLLILVVFVIAKDKRKK